MANKSSEGNDPYIFCTDTMPSETRYYPPLANGLLGWKVYEDVMHMGGIYNGEGGDCHRAEIPCPLAVQMDMVEPGTHSYCLNTNIGVFTHTLSTATVTATQSLYAHRYYEKLMVMEMMLVRQGTGVDPITVDLLTNFQPLSKDIVFETGPDYKGGRHIFGQTIIAEYPGGPYPTAHLIWTDIPATLTLNAGQSQASWSFIVVGADSLQAAESNYDKGLSLMASGTLRSSHEEAWKDLWLQSKIEVVGSEILNQSLIGCMFYLLSAFPSIHDTTTTNFGGVSPGGLSNGRGGQAYYGHVFWDQETWMYPGIALFYPQLARFALQYRMMTIDGAKVNAQKLGYKGVKFPWEGATSGREVCPIEEIGIQQIHINGDVAMAFRHYLYLTEDMSIFTEGRGNEVIWGMADYWVSRVVWDPQDQKYHILGVICPDEYHVNVNNSVFTNAVAKLSLEFAIELAGLLDKATPTEWKEVSEKIKIPFDEASNYHPEFDGYVKGTKVKQADVILLGYPLGYPMSTEIRRNDIVAYESVTDPLGPAMTWSMFAVARLELGEADRAQELLMRSFRNIQGPFQVWSEAPEGVGAVNFLTGMGGLLQAVLFGYTGFRVQKTGLYFNPLLPTEISEVSIRGVNYLGNQLDWILRKEEISITLRGNQCPGSKAPKSYNLQVILKDSGTKIPLVPGQPVTFPREPGFICKLDVNSTCWPL